MKLSNSLKFKIELGQAPLVEVSHAFWTHRKLPVLFPEYLFHLYSAMSTIVPLMEVACVRARELSSSDAAAATLVPYLEEHIEEEREHAKWLREDMEQLGVSSELLNRPPPTSVAALLGTQHYWALHVHPVYILAYFAVLEGKPMARASIERYAVAAKIPECALRTLVMHAETDLHHSDELFDVIDQTALSATQASLLGVNDLQVIQQLT